MNEIKTVHYNVHSFKHLSFLERFCYGWNVLWSKSAHYKLPEDPLSWDYEKNAVEELKQRFITDFDAANKTLNSMTPNTTATITITDPKNTLTLTTGEASTGTFTKDNIENIKTYPIEELAQPGDPIDDQILSIFAQSQLESEYNALKAKWEALLEEDDDNCDANDLSVLDLQAIAENPESSPMEKILASSAAFHRMRAIALSKILFN